MSVATSSLLLAFRAPLLGFPDLPTTTRQAWQGKRTSKEAGEPFVEDQIIPATAMLEGHAKIRGFRTVTGLYLIQWYGTPNQGVALFDTVDAVVALYPPGTSFVTTDGNAATVRDNPAPWAGQAREVNGRTCITITVPYQCVTLTDVPAAA